MRLRRISGARIWIGWFLPACCLGSSLPSLFVHQLPSLSAYWPHSFASCFCILLEGGRPLECPTSGVPDLSFRGRSSGSATYRVADLVQFLFLGLSAFRLVPASRRPRRKGPLLCCVPSRGRGVSLRCFPRVGLIFSVLSGLWLQCLGNPRLLSFGSGR